MDSNTIHRCASRPLVLLLLLALIALTGCGSRQAQDSLVGSTAQRLVSYAIDDLVGALPASDFAELSGQRLRIESHFLGEPAVQAYADQRLAMELGARFGITVVPAPMPSDHVLTVFYTSLGTDRGSRGFFVPLGFVPGVDESAQLNLVTLEQFHGVAELYYFLGRERSAEIVRARRRTDALGLPIITIPLNTLP
ncbi:MAG: hypothetical protein V2J42_12560 [Wenzhouxiangella sp.]|jgi:hypothetical protein|nr:hypothetical protein [Wenzhouxiangella sp.]